MSLLFMYHWKIYAFFTLSVFVPQLFLILNKDWNLPGLGIAFVGIILMTKLMGPSEKECLASSRIKAQEALKKKWERSPSKSEIESLSRDIVQARLFAYYFCGALALALGFVANVQS